MENLMLVTCRGQRVDVINVDTTVRGYKILRADF